MSPIILVGSGVILFALGLGLGYLLSHSLRKREATKASDIQNELDDYRRHVTEHFGETAQHFQEIGKQYQSLYKHMAQGADALCDAAQSDKLLGFAAGGAAAIAADTADESEQQPQVIRDYAPEEEIEPSTVEAEVEAADTTELQESSPEPDDIAVEAPAEEVIDEQVATPETSEEERTVH